MNRKNLPFSGVGFRNFFYRGKDMPQIFFHSFPEQELTAYESCMSREGPLKAY